MKKRILAIALALAMLLPVFAVGPFAATPEEQAQALLDQTSAIFESGKYTLKARGPSLAGKTTSIVFVVDGDRSVFEATMDWVSMLQEMEPANASSMLMGWVMQLLFGSKVRFIAEPDQATIVFVNRRTYIDVPGTPGLALGFTTLFDVPERTATTVSEPVIGGKKYLCAALEGDEDVTTSYYYLNGALKRIGMEALNTDTGQTETFAFEIDLLSPTADQSYFTTNWMLKLSSLFNMILPF